MIKIELATLSELDRVKEIAEACAKNMIENNIFQWNDKYPSREIFKEDIKNKSLYVSKINQEVVGCIMFSSFKDDVYKTVNWICLLYTSPSPRDLSTSRMPSSA